MDERIGPDQWLPADALLDDLLIGNDSALDAALADSQAAGLPPIEVSAQVARLLYVCAHPDQHSVVTAPSATCCR